MENNKVVYSETIDCGSVTQLELFRRARLWASQYSSDSKIILADKETGDLVSSGKIQISLPRSENFAGGIYNFRYTLSVECANRKYRSSINHLEVLDNNNPVGTPLESFNLKSEKDQKELLAALDKKIKEILTDLQLNVKDYKAF
ncbi:DUF4468 domain-containing protein [Dyadobacter diqingensis]|uniref:DUF4468 domain-containing protein n=1 Tax=Dyadobacter diqingensis TaxID=2938121 RepID=UPI0020C3A854|nr:DUF4468 domain-containing protein [Dyadobacter diqingensis]